MRDWIRLKGTYGGYQIRFEHQGQTYELRTKMGVRGHGYIVDLAFDPFKMICVEAKWKDGSLFERLTSKIPLVVPVNCDSLVMESTKRYKSILKEKTYYTNLSTYELNERPDNLVSVEEYFCNPFAYPLEVHALTEIIFRDKVHSDSDKYKRYFQTLETSKINVFNIVPTQRFLKLDKLENWVYLPVDADTIYPEFIKSGNFYYLLDGHHRVAKDIQGGYKIIVGKVIDVENPFSSLEVPRLIEYKSIYSEVKKLSSFEDICALCGKPFKSSDNILWVIESKNGTLVETTEPGSFSVGQTCFTKYNKRVKNK